MEELNYYRAELDKINLDNYISFHFTDSEGNHTNYLNLNSASKTALLLFLAKFEQTEAIKR